MEISHRKSTRIIPNYLWEQLGNCLRKQNTFNQNCPDQTAAPFMSVALQSSRRATMFR